jgi:hypothetical protein
VADGRRLKPSSGKLNNSNAMNEVEYTSNVKLDVNSDYNEIAIILNDEIVEDLENLTTFRCDVSSRDIQVSQNWLPRENRHVPTTKETLN